MHDIIIMSSLVCSGEVGEFTARPQIRDESYYHYWLTQYIGREGGREEGVRDNY